MHSNINKKSYIETNLLNISYYRDVILWIKEMIDRFRLYLMTDYLQTFAAGDRSTTTEGLSRRFLYKLEWSFLCIGGVSNLLSNEVQKSD